LRGADGGHVAAGAAAQNDQIEVHAFGVVKTGQR
jgi:hypothetical protein